MRPNFRIWFSFPFTLNHFSPKSPSRDFDWFGTRLSAILWSIQAASGSLSLAMKSLILTIMAYAGLATAWIPTRYDPLPSHSIHPGQTSIMPRAEQNESARWISASLPIRGVNLGSQFIVEPWMANDEWNSMGCNDTASEFDCVSKLGQAQANTSWAKHWSTWTTKDDISLMQSYGLNAIRIPVGYWMREDLVYQDSEHFPQGGLQYLEQICGWASDAGLYIIIGLHGAPGAQVANNPDTGQVCVSERRGDDWWLILFRTPPRQASTLATSTSVRTNSSNGWQTSSTQTTTTEMSACWRYSTSPFKAVTVKQIPWGKLTTQPRGRAYEWQKQLSTLAPITFCISKWWYELLLPLVPQFYH